MLCKLPFTYLKPSSAGLDSSISRHGDKRKFGCFTRKFSEPKYRFKLVGLSKGDKWHLNDIDASEFANFHYKDLEFYAFQFLLLLCFCFSWYRCLIAVVMLATYVGPYLRGIVVSAYAKYALL